MKILPKMMGAGAPLPDARLIDRFMSARRILLTTAVLVAGTVLCAWLFPRLGGMLPADWSLMKSNTAIVVLLSLASLELRQAGRWSGLARLLGLVVAALAISAWLGHLAGHVSRLDVLLASQGGDAQPGPMSAHTAGFFALMGLFLMIVEPGDGRVLRAVSDLLTVVLGGVVLVILAGYVFSVLALFGQSMGIRTSPQTLYCMAVLVFLAMILRLRTEPFSLLVTHGIGSHIVRVTALWAVLIPFALVSGGVFLIEEIGFSMPQAAALTASAMAMLLFVTILWLAARINHLELELRDQSLTDELTGVYNRRAFYMLGEYMFSEGKRDGVPLTILFFDLDGLKRVNDTLGHDAGSELICDFARLLSARFRDSDVVARLGGDEFAVLARGQDFLGAAVQRLEQEVRARNDEAGRPYQIGYSVGQASAEPASMASFAELVARADAAMYEQKHRKKGHPA